MGLFTSPFIWVKSTGEGISPSRYPSAEERLKTPVFASSRYFKKEGLMGAILTVSFAALMKKEVKRIEREREEIMANGVFFFICNSDDDYLK